MKNQGSLWSLLLLVSGMLVTGSAAATVQTLNAQASGGSYTTDSGIATSASVVSCTQASGGQNGSYCFITAPGWSGILRAGEAIGTTGPGNVTLRCNGTYSASGGQLRCTAKIDDQICSPEQTIAGSASGGGSTRGLAPIKSAAIVQCTQASGGQNGSSRCYIQSPGFTGPMTAGQSIGTSGAGTVNLSCNGQYSANGGSLSCSAQVSQVCP